MGERIPNMDLGIKNRLNALMCMEEPDGGGAGDPQVNITPANDPPADKTFTQEQVNSMIATEKRNFQSKAYKSLGFDTEEDAKAFIEKYREQEENNKSELEKAQQRAATLEAEKKAEQLKAQTLENRFKAIKEGCPAESADDVVVLAMAKVSDTKDFETALKEIKDQYPAMFGKVEGNGTGGGRTVARKKLQAGDTAGMGKRLAEAKKKNLAASSNEYFK